MRDTKGYHCSPIKLYYDYNNNKHVHDTNEGGQASNKAAAHAVFVTKLKKEKKCGYVSVKILIFILTVGWL